MPTTQSAAADFGGSKELPRWCFRVSPSPPMKRLGLPRLPNPRCRIVIRLANGKWHSKELPWWEGFRIPPPPPPPATETFRITRDYGLLVICAFPSLFSLVDFEDKLSTNAQEKINFQAHWTAAIAKEQ